MFFGIPALFVLLLNTPICAGMGITGGKEAIPHARRYMALVRTGSNLCGGTLIKDNWVLTAATCKVDRTTTVDLGVHSIKTMNKLRQQFKVARWVPHQKFDRRSYVNNLQLLQLSKAAVLGSDVSVLPLSVKRKKLQPGTVCETAGWGTTTNHRNIISDKLMEVNVTIVDTKTCAKRWKPLINITRNMICTSENVEVKGTCGGDSGGPLICNGSLRGLTSFGMPECALPGDASVYAKLNRNIIRWINKIISGVHKIF
uniref:Provisional ortholog of granzyme A n=1 Tax=Xenopus tropicalis TaxID=8364 RepID=A0A6I8T0K8_XENTR